MVHYLTDPTFLVSLIALVVAGWSALTSWQSRGIAARALAISEAQEQRHKPELAIYLTQGYRQYLPAKQLFRFLISVTNPTDIDNSIAQAELQVTYVLDGDIKATFRVPHNSRLHEAAKTPEESTGNVFSLPIRIDAHQTVAGWLLFDVGSDLLGGRTIDSHRIILEDSHGLLTETEPIIVRELANEDQQSIY